MSSGEPTLGMKDQDLTETNIETNLLGTIAHSFETHVGFWAFEYLDGLIYGVDGQSSNLYVYNAVTGVSTDNISIPFPSKGITTDGTNLYLSIYTITTPNGTIVKMDTAGNEISRFSVPIGVGIIADLTFDGDFLWANQETGYSLLRIDPDTGIISKNISIPFVSHGITLYRNKIWANYFSADSVYAFDVNTGVHTDRFASPFHFDSGLACNSTHFMQSRYINAMDPYAVVFYELPQEPGDIYTNSISLMTNILDITYVNDYVYFSENSSTYIYGISDSTGSGFTSWSTGSFIPVGLTVINDNYFLMSPKFAPYNFYTFTLDGTLLMNQTSEVDIMSMALEFDGTFVWAMGFDRILYKLDPIDMSIVDQFPLPGYICGIAYDYDLDVLWAIDKSDHTIKYINTTNGELGENTFDIQTPISPTERSIAYDGEFLIISCTQGGSYYYKILKGELDPEDPPVTPTPTPSITDPTGLIPGVTPLIEDLIFLGIGAVSVALIAIVISVIIKAKK